MQYLYEKYIDKVSVKRYYIIAIEIKDNRKGNKKVR